MSVDYLSAINRQGSGLNITEIVDSLVEAETAPQVDRIQKDIDQKKIKKAADKSLKQFKDNLENK